MKVDPKIFVETMERYNKFCEDEKDLDYEKPAEYLRPIRKPPFHAFFGYRWSQCTKGRHGICVNSNFEVMDAKGKVMPGLYAAGDNCLIFGGLILNRVSWGSGEPLKPEDFTTEAFDPAQCEGESSAASGKNQFPGVDYPCGGCGPAFISGYYAGTYVSEYLKNI